jgi:predicted Zn-dependent protease
LELLEQSEQFEEQLEKNGGVYNDEKLNKYLDEVGRAVIPEGDPPERTRWRFRVIRSPYANAFALPNGSIYLSTGLLSLLENESQLASVIAHESAHVLNRHAFAFYKSARNRIRLINIAALAEAWAPLFGTVGSAVAMLATVSRIALVLTIYSYSRELETEADVHAAHRLLELNYDAKELLKTFRLLETSYEAEYVKLYYRNHPTLQKRIDYTSLELQSNPQQPVSAEQRAVYRVRYLSRTEKVLRHNVRLNVENRRFRTALALSQKLVEFRPESSENILLRADAFRELGPRTIEVRGEELSEKAWKIKQKLTPDEEERLLLATPPGRAALRTNQENADGLYRKALGLDSNNARAHLGFAFLLEQMQRPQEAAEHYREYLRLEPEARDGGRIRRRIEKINARPPL